MRSPRRREIGNLCTFVIAGASRDGRALGTGPSPSATPLRLLQVEVLGLVEDAETISAVMSGWHEAMARPEGVAWVRNRLAHVADEQADPPAQPSRHFDAY